MIPRIRAGLLVLAFTSLANAGSVTPWKQSELNETYMRTLSVSQCVGKLIQSLEQVCGDDPSCLKTLAGASGDCMAWAANDVGSMCEYFPSQVTPECVAGRLSPLQCKSMSLLTKVFCDGSLMTNDKEIDLSPKELFQKVAPSTVLVFGLNSNEESDTQGSGVVVAPSIVATNCHVLRGSQAFVVKYEGREYPATVQYSDVVRDVCTLQAPGLKAPAGYLNPDGTRQLEIGDKVYAVGAPRGLDLTLSDGLLSGFRQEKHGRYVQISAPISPGSSGGGLWDQTGSLIGLTTSYLDDSQQLNFAVPIEWVLELPGRAEDPANVEAAKAYAAEAVTNLEHSLKASDPKYACKKKLALPEVKKVKDSVNLLMLASVFIAYYKAIDDSRCP